MVGSFLLIAATIAMTPAPRACPPEASVQAAFPAAPNALLRPQDRRGDRGAQTLGSMPKADLHQTVIRSIDGCPISSRIRENVQGDGRFARPR
ncbi:MULTISPECIES: hypothetical protein [Phenylobacterium]|uniref:Uncharacterized protein n=1 Tax=Phenylobacterium koreense TaxID=266125 RepID=A0ABV2EH82_9CAUL